MLHTFLSCLKSEAIIFEIWDSANPAILTNSNHCTNIFPFVKYWGDNPFSKVKSRSLI